MDVTFVNQNATVQTSGQYVGSTILRPQRSTFGASTPSFYWFIPDPEELQRLDFEHLREAKKNVEREVRAGLAAGDVLLVAPDPPRYLALREPFRRPDLSDPGTDQRKELLLREHSASKPGFTLRAVTSYKM